MSAMTKADAEFEEMLATDIAEFQFDPVGFVMYAFPWQLHPSLLAKKGPRRWQVDVLNHLGAALRAGKDVGEAVRIAVASGHGPGKSTLMAWIVLWALSTFEDARGVITANTDTQLRTKTMPELSKWYYLAVNRHWFTLTATSLYYSDEKHSKNWRLDAVPWSEHNTEAFAGLHNQGKRIFVLFDEAAGIADNVWEVTEGALTDADTELIWVAFGNPTRNVGRFKDCFDNLAHRWWTQQIDSRDVEGVNRAYLDSLVEDYGEDSDFVRSRVRGVFPSSGTMQFFSNELVDACMRRTIGIENDYYGKVLGVDVARHGDDASVIVRRQGRIVTGVKRLRIPDLMEIARVVAQEIRDWEPDTTFVDATGMGWGVVDRLNQLNHQNIIAVQVGEKASRDDRYVNRRTELYFEMREWMTNGGQLPSDKAWKEQLIAVEYGYDNKKGKLEIEQKATMKARGIPSPDETDALMVTFDSPVGMTLTPRKSSVLQELEDMMQRQRSPMSS